MLNQVICKLAQHNAQGFHRPLLITLNFFLCISRVCDDFKRLILAAPVIKKILTQSHAGCHDPIHFYLNDKYI